MDEKMTKYRARIIAEKTGQSLEDATAIARHEAMSEEDLRKMTRYQEAAEKGKRELKKMKQDRRNSLRTSADALHDSKKQGGKFRGIVLGGAFELGKKR